MTGGALLAASLHGEIPRPDDAPLPKTPEESAAGYVLPEGFRMEVIASEPLVSAPSGVCWDAQGRMFVSELHGYNYEGKLDIDELNKTGELDMKVRRIQASDELKRKAEEGTYGVVKLLRDTDGDGRMDEADVWADDLPAAYGLVAARDGVIVACAPDIVFLADRNGDGKAEIRETLFTGFKVGMLERGINAPTWGDDGWIYFGRGWSGSQVSGPGIDGVYELPDTDFRIRPGGSAIEPVTGGTHTLGFATTEAGDRFVANTVSPGRFVAPLPWQYLLRNPNAFVSDIERRTGDRKAYAIAPAHPWRAKRYEHPGYYEFYHSRLGDAEIEPSGWFTAACGPMIYRDSVLPGLNGLYFVCEPSGNLIHRAELIQEGSGIELRRLPSDERKEFAASSDQWSHPIYLSHGPDGAIWVVDYYREIIEDYSAIPRYLQQQYDVYSGHDYGRIYRLIHDDAALALTVDMSRWSATRLAQATQSEIYWQRQTAQRLLIEGERMDAVPALRQTWSSRNASSSGKIAAMRTLAGLSALEASDLVPLVTDASQSVRIHALQLSERFLDASDRLLTEVSRSAKSEESARVRIQFALSLGESDSVEAFKVLADYARQHSQSDWMSDAILSSISGNGPEMLSELLRDPGEGEDMIGTVAAMIASSDDAASIEGALTAIANAPWDYQAVALAALADARSNAPGLTLSDDRSLQELKASSDEKIATLANSLESYLNAPIADENATPEIALDRQYSVLPVSDEVFAKYVSALSGQRDVERGGDLFQQICAVCHKIGHIGFEVAPDIMGELGVAEESLLQHLLKPNDRIRPGYQLTLVALKNGNSLSGILKDDGATSVTIALPGGVTQTVLRKYISKVSRRPISLMPSYAGILTPEDAANVISWLQAQRN